jgi:hypothetical protein
MFVNSPEKRLSEPLEDQPLSAGDSPASLTALQENVRHLVMNVILRENSKESFGRLNPDGSLLKTSRGSAQASLDGSLESSCMTFPKWGILSDGVVGELLMLEPATEGSESLLLPTYRSHEAGNYQYSGGDHGKPVLTLSGAVAMLPTPRAEEKCQHNSQDAGMSLSKTIALLPTPNARDYKDTGINTDYRKLAGKSKLAGKIAMLPTVTTPSPHDNEEMAGKYIPSQNQKDLTYSLGKNHGLKLQPAFAEWMMGFPEGWTALDASEMQLYLPKSIRSSKRLQKLKTGEIKS